MSQVTETGTQILKNSKLNRFRFGQKVIIKRMLRKFKIAIFEEVAGHTETR